MMRSLEDVTIFLQLDALISNKFSPKKIFTIDIYLICVDLPSLLKKIVQNYQGFNFSSY